MAKSQKIESREREFLRLVARAAFSNPFGEARREADRRIAGITGEMTDHEAQARAVEAVGARVSELEKNLAPGDLSRDDREVVETAFLFDAYHRFGADFDRHIEKQLASGDTPVMVPFAPELLGLLVKRGLTRETALQYLGFFFQLRRAYFFIDRNLTGRGPAMRALKRHLWNNVFTQDVRWYRRYLWNRMEDFSTLLLGETGTGKGTAAAAIGRSGFIPFDEEKNGPATNNQNLLEKADAFRAEGQRIRTGQKEVETEQPDRAATQEPARRAGS